MWLNVRPFNSNRHILCGALYRPPSTNSTIDLRIESNIELAYLKNHETIIMGDFNIDFLKPTIYKKHLLSKALKSMQFTQLINTATRPISSSCLDHVYTSHKQFISHLSVPDIGLADHLPTFICRKYTKERQETGNHKKQKHKKPEFK